MKKLNLLIKASLLGVGVLSFGALSAEQLSTNLIGPQVQVSQQEYIVIFKSVAELNGLSNNDYMQSQTIKLTNNENITIKKVYKYTRSMLIQANEATIDALRADENVQSVTPNHVLRDLPEKQVSLNTMAQLQNGPQQAASWGIDRVDQRYLNLDGQYSSEAKGTGVTAYVLDTGTVTSSNEFFRENGESRLRMGYNPFRDNFDSADCHGHGSHVAGTIGGTTYGVAKDVDVVAVRVMECGEVKTVANIVEGMNWVIEDVANHQGPAVVNMSLSDPEGSVAWDNATQAMIDYGITVVVAAGNNYYDACINSPARLRSAITVGATDKYDFYNNLSNYGECVDILAPGSSITSIDENGQPWTISGTSMAAPHVAGAAALVLEKNPSFNHYQVKQYLLERSTKGVISGTAGAGDTAERSPNKLLYIGDDIGAPLDAPVVDSGETVQVDMPSGGLAYYTTIVGEGAEQLKVTIDSDGESDLFVNYDDVATSNPISFGNDCKQTNFGGYEVCEFSAPEPGTWHILVVSGSIASDIELTVSHNGNSVDICDTSPQSADCICPNEPSNPICLPDPTPDPTPGLTELTSGEAVGVNLPNKAEAFYYIDITGEQKTLSVTTAGQIGDLDLKVLFGEEGQQAELCSSATSSSNESCVIENAAPGRYFITLEGYTAVENATVKAIVSEVTGCQNDCDTDVVSLLNLTQLNSASQLVYPVIVPAGKTLKVTTTGGTGDVELLVNYNEQASSWWSSDCSSTNSGNNESCEITNTQAGTYYIVLKEYEDFAQVSLSASYE